jgi:hypothetical protein
VLPGCPQEFALDQIPPELDQEIVHMRSGLIQFPAAGNQEREHAFRTLQIAAQHPALKRDPSNRHRGLALDVDKRFPIPGFRPPDGTGRLHQPLELGSITGIRDEMGPFQQRRQIKLAGNVR